jgi:hypothetical protein
MLDVLKISAQSINASHWEWQREQELHQAWNPQSSAKSSGTDGKSTSNDSSTAQAGDSKKKKKGSGGNRGNSGGSSTQTSSSLASEKLYAKVLGSDGKLLPAEKARQLAENLCLLCGGKGHHSNEYPKKPAAGRTANTDLAVSAPAPAAQSGN